MRDFLGRYQDRVYPVTRFVIGFLFACHGAQKLFGVLGGRRELHDPQGLLAGVIEFFGGSLVALGLFVGIAALIASGEMAVAYFQAHAPHGFWPILNGGERAVFYCFFFLYAATQGSGRFSVERLFRRTRSRL